MPVLHPASGRLQSAEPDMMLDGGSSGSQCGKHWFDDATFLGLMGLGDLE